MVYHMVMAHCSTWTMYPIKDVGIMAKSTDLKPCVRKMVRFTMGISYMESHMDMASLVIEPIRSHEV